MLYIFNSLIIPISQQYNTATVTFRRVTVEEAKKLLETEAFISAVGHESTANLLSRLLDRPIAMNRITVAMSVGDQALHFVLKTRLPEGRVLSEEELRNFEFELIHSKVVSAQ